MIRTLLAITLSALAASAAIAQSTIKIGEINSYSTMPQFTQPYRQGWQLAVEEVNAAGGLLGRKVEVIARDDAGTTSTSCPARVRFPYSAHHRPWRSKCPP